MMEEDGLDALVELARPVLGEILAEPLAFEELKRKPGRRVTLRASGPRGSAIVKLYASDRASTVAARVNALAGGPPEPLVPRVLCVDRRLGLVALSELRGAPLRDFVLWGDRPACRRAGAALGAWHSFWREAPVPPTLARHTAHRELELLQARAYAAPVSIGRTAAWLAASMAGPWSCPTVVHRDLYEEQVLLGERVALIDLDDAALGPPELDLGNLIAHLELLAGRVGRPLTPAVEALLAGYRAVGGTLDVGLLDRCRRLSLLRLACIHREPSLVEAVAA